MRRDWKIDKVCAVGCFEGKYNEVTYRRHDYYDLSPEINVQLYLQYSIIILPVISPMHSTSYF